MVTKGHTHLHNPAVERFKFVLRFGTTRHERANKIHAHGLALLETIENKIKRLVAHYYASFIKVK